MAYSTCVKCGNRSFEILENSPKGSNYKLMFVQCTSCGGVIGVMEYYNIGAKIEELEIKLKNIATISSVNLINNNLDVINKNVQSIIRALPANK